jgi:hypothetical protein
MPVTVVAGIGFFAGWATRPAGGLTAIACCVIIQPCKEGGRIMFSIGFRLISDDIRFAGVLPKSPKTAIQFEGGQKRKYKYGVSCRSIYKSPNMYKR